MPQLNKLLVGLVGLAIVILVVLSLYEIFLKPPESVPNDRIQQINTYYGEDVLQFINGSQSTTTTQ
jgi:hypothetical protein